MRACYRTVDGLPTQDFRTPESRMAVGRMLGHPTPDRGRTLGHPTLDRGRTLGHPTLDRGRTPDRARTLAARCCRFTPRARR
jgi:hypothetical protein